MTSSILRAVASGNTNVFAVPPYLDKSHVIVSLNGAKVDPSALTWVNDGTVSLNAGNPSPGTLVERRRRTPGTPMAEFRPGGLDSGDLNTAIRQALYLAEEARDLSADGESRAWFTTALASGGLITKGLEGSVPKFDGKGDLTGSISASDIASAQDAAATAVRSMEAALAVASALVSLSANSLTSAAALNLTGFKSVLVHRFGDSSPLCPAFYEEVAQPANVEPGHAAKFKDLSGKWFQLRSPYIDPAMLGASYGGSVDCRAAILLADTVALLQGKELLLTGRARISASTIIASPLIAPKGGTLAVDAGVTVYLKGGFQAGFYKVFDYASMTSKVWTANRTMHGEWWGLSPDRMDNNVPLQQACDASAGFYADTVTYADAPVIGGTVMINTDRTYHMQDTVNVKNMTVIRGVSRFTTIAPDVPNWNVAAKQLFLFQRDDAGVFKSQFNCRLENMRVSGLGFTGLDHLVYATSWNEQCGTRNVWFDRIYRNGVTIKEGYGGAATSSIVETEFWLDANHSLTARGLNVDMQGAATVGWYNLLVQHCVAITPDNPVNGQPIGIFVSGRVELSLHGYHPEHINPVWLEGDATVYGSSINGGNLCPNVFFLGPTWNKAVGRIDCDARIGGATLLVQDGTGSGYRAYRTEPGTGRLQYPPDPNRALGSVAVTGGATTSPTADFAIGNLSGAIGKPSTGVYSFTIPTAFGAATHYRVRVDVDFVSGSAMPPQHTVIRNTASQFDVRFRDAAGAPTDVGDFTVHVLHNP